jgi:hypothetical protein
MGLFLDHQDGKIKYSDVCVYCYLLAKQGANDKLWWGIDHLKLLTGIDESCLKRAFKRLIKAGHIKRVKRGDKQPSDTICLTRVDGRDPIIKGLVAVNTIPAVPLADSTGTLRDLGDGTATQVARERRGASLAERHREPMPLSQRPVRLTATDASMIASDLELTDSSSVDDPFVQEPSNVSDDSDREPFG